MISAGLLAVEGLIGLFFIFCLSRRPICCGILTLILAITASIGLHLMWGIGPFDKIIGSEIVGKKTMRAAISDPAQVEGVALDFNVPIPDQTNYHALIQIKAAGLNPSNYKLGFSNIPFLRHIRKFVVGYDVAGVVLSVGSDPSCKHLKKGDEIYGVCPSGSFAEYAACFCRTISKKPKNLSFVQAASLPVAAFTTQEAYVRGKLKQGDNVLVVGASGGCGIFGVELAKALGAKVTGICSTKNVDFVRSLGADKVVDYKDENDMQGLLAGGKQFDVIYDTVSSFDPVDPNYVPLLTPILKEGGNYIAINGQWSEWIPGLVDTLFGINIHRPGYQLFLLMPNVAAIDKLTAIFESGKIKDVVIDTIFRLDNNEDLTNAFAKMKSRRTVGKIVFEIAK